MKIDLRAYRSELQFWVDAFDQFIDRGSISGLKGVLSSLEDGIDRGENSFEWKVPAAIRTKTSTRYDGRNKVTHEVRLSWQFTSKFNLGGERRKPIWTIEEMSTHIRVFASPKDQAADPAILHFHFDMKGVDTQQVPQLGPHSHMQLSEHFQKERGRIPIAVPRFPSAVMLPTDCLDLVLSEFFPHEWPKAQSGATGIDVLRTRQRSRMRAMASALLQKWDEAKRQTPVSITQDSYVPEIQIA